MRIPTFEKLLDFVSQSNLRELRDINIVLHDSSNCSNCVMSGDLTYGNTPTSTLQLLRNDLARQKRFLAQKKIIIATRANTRTASYNILIFKIPTNS